MTDPVPATGPADPLDETTHLRPNPLQLKFPTIDLDTSLESLLSHSTPTPSEASVIMAPEPSSHQHALDESWASLDVSDFPHDDDDDTQSVNTDVGSLVDLSTVEDDSESEVDVDKEMSTQRVFRYSEQVDQPEQHDTSTYDAMDHTIIFRQSPSQTSPLAVDMEYSTSAQENITMAISPNDLKHFDAPVRIAYYGSRYPPDTKDELLGKIGAALITPSSTPGSGTSTSTSSTCFNIVPTEFGRDFKPAFADLVPSHAQMTVDELSGLASDRSDTVRLLLKNGITLDSALSDGSEAADRTEFQPDLLVIHLSHEDCDEGFTQSTALQLLAIRHHWPTIIVAENASCTPSDPHRLPRKYGIQINTQMEENGNSESRRPIDLDAFMAMDTVQLGRHIMHIIETASVKFEKEATAAKLQGSYFADIRHSLFGGKVRRYVLKLGETKTEEPTRHTTKKLVSDYFKSSPSILRTRQYVKDTLFTLIVMALGVLVVSFSQDLAPRVHGLVAYKNTSITSTKMDGTTTVTATSAITTSTNTAVALIHQDVAPDDSLLFGQMWQQFTGRLMPEHEAEKNTEVPVKEEKLMDEPETVEKTPTTDDILQYAADWLRPKLDKIRDRARARRSVWKSRIHSSKLSERVEARQLRQKLQDLYDDTMTSVQRLSSSKRREFWSLITQSQYHLDQTRKAGEEELRRRVAEQKTVLSQAQNQAQHIVTASKKRRSIFRRRH